MKPKLDFFVFMEDTLYSSNITLHSTLNQQPLLWNMTVAASCCEDGFIQ